MKQMYQEWKERSFENTNLPKYHEWLYENNSLHYIKNQGTQTLSPSDKQQK